MSVWCSFNDSRLGFFEIVSHRLRSTAGATQNLRVLKFLADQGYSNVACLPFGDRANAKNLCIVKISSGAGWD
eukprot:SAG11_NODE_748_length_7364_cov_106.871025_1_plen_73_part_00